MANGGGKIPAQPGLVKQTGYSLGDFLSASLGILQVQTTPAPSWIHDRKKKNPKNSLNYAVRFQGFGYG
jgi:hypothetical protein